MMAAQGIRRAELTREAGIDADDVPGQGNGVTSRRRKTGEKPGKNRDIT
jgi:hypothetical protein